MVPRKTVLSTSFGIPRKTQIKMLTTMFAPKIQRFFTNQFVLPIQWVKVFDTLDSQGKSWILNLEATKDGIYYQVNVQHRTIRPIWKIEFTVWYQHFESKSQTEKVTFHDSTSFYKLLFFILVRVPKSSGKKFMISEFMVGRKSILQMSLGWNESTLRYVIDTLGLTLPIKSPISNDFLLDEETFLVRFFNATTEQKKKILGVAQRQS